MHPLCLSLHILHHRPTEIHKSHTAQHLSASSLLLVPFHSLTPVSIMNKHTIHWFVSTPLTFIFRKQTACADFPNVVAQRHVLFGGGHTQEGYDPQILTWPRFLYTAPNPKFHHPTLTRSEVIVLTNTQSNKQRDAAKNIQRSSLYAMTLDNKNICCVITVSYTHLTLPTNREV